MALLSRNSALAVVPESTSGTPVAPTAAGQYMALQSDFSITPSIGILENAEIKASLAPSKPILGIEEPTCTLSHYLKHSGTEGVAPEMDELFTGAFGSEVIAGTEYQTVSSSTVSTIKVNTGIGANFQRGQALLIKDGTNGYSIRPVHSVSTDDLSLGFTLENAPASGVSLGKAVLYKPANSSHQSMSIWHYAANSGAVQLVAGAKVTEVGISFASGELINCNFSMTGTGYYFNPIEITSATKYLDFTDSTGTYACAVATGFYKDPHDLASALQTAISSVTAKIITVTYSNSTGKFTIATSDSVTLSLLWNTGANTANTIATKIGFSSAANSTGALTYTSASAITLTSPQTASIDSSDPLVAKSNELFVGDSTDSSCIAASTIDFKLSDSNTSLKSICSSSGVSDILVTMREVTISITAILNQYDADKFKRMREGTTTKMSYAFGSKVGGNWVAGKCGLIYVPTCVVQSCSVTDVDGILRLQMELKAFSDSSGNGEVYLNFL